MRLCRTSALGAHALVCSECGSKDVSFNSCRDRHCPKCQHSVQQV
ncbi:transposase zinc-binding domain-containing protein [Desulfosporosinus sp. SRJS8]|nr:transposase zinc-binding domain-containing protein [Desulfosporosinus sp. SRJS8]